MVWMDFDVFIFLFSWLRYSSHVRAFTIFKCTIQWVLVCSPTGATITKLSNTRTFPHPIEETSCPLAVIPHSSAPPFPPPGPATANLLLSLDLLYWTYHVSGSIHNMCPFAPGFSDSAPCCQGPSCCSRCSGLLPFCG